MSTDSGRLVVLGIGNVLLRDDGVGVHVVGELGRQAAGGEVLLPPRTELVDGGTLGLGLLPLLAGARGLLLVDAALLGGAPGDVTVLRYDALRTDHGGPRAILPAGIADLLAAARLSNVLPGAVSLVGVEPGAIEAGLDLTPEVRAALPVAVEASIQAAWGLSHQAAGVPA